MLLMNNFDDYILWVDSMNLFFSLIEQYVYLLKFYIDNFYRGVLKYIIFV